MKREKCDGRSGPDRGRSPIECSEQPNDSGHGEIRNRTSIVCSDMHPHANPAVRTSIASAAAILALASACGQPVGYVGPLPSVAARASLDSLIGRTLPAGSMRRADGAIAYESFLVGPHGPTAVFVTQPSTGAESPKRHWLPLLTDGDIADLHRRITGDVPAGLVGPLSDAYRAAMSER